MSENPNYPPKKDYPFSSEIELATLGALDRYIGKEKPKVIRIGTKLGQKDIEHPLGHWSTFTSDKNPAVILDTGAAFCSPIIVYDGHGNALHMHDSLTSQTPEKWDTYRQFLFESRQLITGPNIKFCLTGTNEDLIDHGKSLDIHPTDSFIAKIEEYARQVLPKATILQPQVAKLYPNQRNVSTLVPNGERVAGFVFVPQTLAVDHSNHLLITLWRDAEAIRQRLIGRT